VDRGAQGCETGGLIDDAMIVRAAAAATGSECGSGRRRMRRAAHHGRRRARIAGANAMFARNLVALCRIQAAHAR
jgi:hypothetical protein